MIVYKSHGLIKIEERWFDSQITEDKEKSDLIMYMNLFQPIDGNSIKLLRKSETLITDLTQSVEDIFGTFSKSTKYNIRRADRDGYRTFFFESPSNVQIQNFCKIHTDLYRKKRLKGSSPREKLETYISSGNLMISTAGKESMDEVSFHVYFVDGCNVRSLYSVNKFRDYDEERNELGRANRKHHFDDIVYFKEHGYTLYDWGGCREEGNVKSIAEFKLGFGGIKKETYYYIEHVSIKGKLAASMLFK